MQPGVAIESAKAVLAGLRRRYPRARSAHPDYLCYAASDRLATIRLVIDASDLTILLGDPEVTASNAASVEIVGDPATTLRPSWLAAAECVGIASMDSSSVRPLTRLIDMLSGLGPLAVVHRRVTTRIAPPDLGNGRFAPHSLDLCRSGA